MIRNRRKMTAGTKMISEEKVLGEVPITGKRVSHQQGSMMMDMK